MSQPPPWNQPQPWNQPPPWGHQPAGPPPRADGGGVPLLVLGLVTALLGLLGAFLPNYSYGDGIGTYSPLLQTINGDTFFQAAEAAKAVDRRLQEQADQIAALDKSVAQRAEVGTVQAALRVVAADRVVSALESGMPYAEPLATLRKLDPATEAQTCEAARRALLSQGYLISAANADLVTGRKNFQPAAEVHVEVEFRVVCAHEGASEGGAAKASS